MKFFKKTSIKTKVLLVVLVGLFGLWANLVYNYMVAAHNEVRLSNVTTVYYPVLEKIDANIVRINQITDQLNSAASMGELEYLNDASANAQEVIQIFNEIGQLEQDIESDIQLLVVKFNNYFSTAEKISRAMIEDHENVSKLGTSIADMRNSLNALKDALTTFREKSYERFSTTISAADRASTTALKTGLIIGLAATLVVLLFGLFISNAIDRNTRQIVNSLDELATGKGDLTQRLHSNSADELGQLVGNFNIFVGKLQEIVRDVTSYSTQVATAAQEMSAISEESSTSLQMQEQEIEAVATSINEMHATIQEVARHTDSAAQLAETAAREAESGKQVVFKALDSIGNLAGGVDSASEVINQLKEDSENISLVLDVIRSIADQTNLLALNAAIEAARAGEQGRGFAVVADEVRTLASRTQVSTQDIQRIIDNLQSSAQKAVQVMDESQAIARQSVEQAQDAGGSLTTITRSIISISELASQIASAMEEQNSVANEINRNIANISRSSGNSSLSSRQVAKSSEELAGLAARLNSLVNQFRA